MMPGRWPDIFIVGAMKAGTTSLYNLLGEHPDLFLPREKEPSYFLWSNYCSSTQFKVPTRRGLISADHWMVVRTQRQYQALFRRAGPDQMTGEASTFYLPDPHVAERIRLAVPHAKIIAILRNPVERAYSAYSFQQSLGVEPAPTFREAILAEQRGDRNEWLYGWRHIHCSNYARQLQRYYREFGEDAVLVLDFDAFNRDPHATARRIFAFIGLDPSIELQGREASNRTAIPANALATRAKFLLSRPNSFKDTLKHVLPRVARRELRQAALSFVDRFSKPPQPLGSDDRELLLELLAPDRERLRRLLGADFASWLQG